jgi:hypothetical protein
LGDDGGTRRRKKPTSEEVGEWGGRRCQTSPIGRDSRKEQNLTCNDTKKKGIRRKKRIYQGANWVDLTVEGERSEPGVRRQALLLTAGESLVRSGST